VDAVKQAMGPDVAAILFEPIQGEGGVLPAPSGFVAALRRIADEHGALLLADEIQTGVGRTGRFLGVQHEGVTVDALTLAKGLAGGVPIGAMLCGAHLADALPPGSHGTTFGGNPLASAAALAVLDVIESEGLVAKAAELGDYLAKRLAELAQKHERLAATSRGRGLLQALVLRDEVDARDVVSRLRDAGVLITVAGGQGLRLSPALVVTQAELDEGLGIIDDVLGRTK
jgi:acetylornithine/N-succinyldiaminopimelate aminotransferase